MTRTASNEKYEEQYKLLHKKLQLKYCFDRFLSFILLLLSWPIFAGVMIMIIADGLMHPENKGPIFYTEPRISEGRLFKIIKFRTVTTDKVEWIRKKPEERCITGCQGKTASGKILLNWYLDELPQLFNILAGQMSFVGPRPHIQREHEEEVQKGLTYRNFLKAGLLGIPQACKNDEGCEKKFMRLAQSHHSNISALNTLDGLYVNECMRLSVWEILWFDLFLLFKGLGVVFRGSGEL